VGYLVFLAVAFVDHQWIHLGKSLALLPSFSIGIISLSILVTWIFCRTANSLVPLAITQFSFNTSLNLFGPQEIGLVPTLPLFGLTVEFCLLTVIVVWVASGLRLNRFREFVVKRTCHWLESVPSLSMITVMKSL